MKQAGELVQIERFADDRVNDRSVEHRVSDLRKRSQDDDDGTFGGRGGVFAEPGNDASAVEPRHHQIEKDDSVSRAVDLIERIDSVACSAAIQSQSLQRDEHELANRFIIVDDQNVFLWFCAHVPSGDNNPPSTVTNVSG